MKFADGERVHLINRKGRHYPLTLYKGKVFQFSGESISHDDIIGKEDGVTVTLSRGSKFIVVRPTLSEYILKMPRGAQIMYPKDIGMSLMWGDIYQGAKVVEAGIGSGALTMALLRAVGDRGVIISYEVRDDFYRRALDNVRLYLGRTDNLIIRQKDIYDGIDEGDIDRIILDLPEPWRVVGHAANTLRSGGIFLCYLPTVLQVSKVVQSLKEADTFIQIETFETLFRTWHVEENSIRPDHRMVAHTGFITVARKAGKK